jgi:hypothetical protein
MDELKPKYFINGFIFFLILGSAAVVDHIYFVATFLFVFSVICLLCAICDSLKERMEAKAYEKYYERNTGGSSFNQLY